jgi:hypothetical protein
MKRETRMTAARDQREESAAGMRAVSGSEGTVTEIEGARKEAETEGKEGETEGEKERATAALRRVLIGQVSETGSVTAAANALVTEIRKENGLNETVHVIEKESERESESESEKEREREREREREIGRERERKKETERERETRDGKKNANEKEIDGSGRAKDHSSIASETQRGPRKGSARGINLQVARTQAAEGTRALAAHLS